jgi:uncharacterized protein (TIGR03083 family)
METAEHIAALRAQGLMLADAARRAGPGTAVPTCPGWAVRDLVAHTGGVHRWATAFVAEGRTEAMGDDEKLRYYDTAPGDPDLVDWYTECHAALVAALESAPPGLACWSFLPAPSPVAFWARRQAHEAAVHRVDAQTAAGRVTPPDAALAADGIDELLSCFLTRPGGRLRADPARVLGVRAADTDTDWTVRIGPDKVEVLHGACVSADCAVTGAAADVYLLLWNRAGTDRLRVEGDDSLLDDWRGSARIRWSGPRARSVTR